MGRYQFPRGKRIFSKVKRCFVIKSNYVEIVTQTWIPSPTAVFVPIHVSVDAPVPVPIAASSSLRGREAIAQFDYEAAEDNEVSFQTGQVITNIDFVTDEWWAGNVDGIVGLFPSNYVQL